MKRQNSPLVICCIVCFTLLAGCNSGSKTSTSTSPSANTKAVFADALVVGLSYSCGSQQGVTGTGGAFTCPANSTVTLSIGGITVCGAPVQPFMTPVSCAQVTDPTANTSTPSVLAESQFLISISTTPFSSGLLTITPAELQAAANLSLNFSTATQSQLQAAVTAIDPGATLVSAATAQAELDGTVTGGAAGSYSGTFSGGDSGTWTATISSNGNVAGTFTDSSGSPGAISGKLVNGTQYQGTASTATWTGNLNTSQTPNVFRGTWSDQSSGLTGTFTGHN